MKPAADDGGGPTGSAAALSALYNLVLQHFALLSQTREFFMQYLHEKHRCSHNTHRQSFYAATWSFLFGGILGLCGSNARSKAISFTPAYPAPALHKRTVSSHKSFVTDVHLPLAQHHAPTRLSRHERATVLALLFQVLPAELHSRPSAKRNCKAKGSVIIAR